MKNYYLSYQYNGGFGCVGLTNIPSIETPQDVIELANKIAKSINQPVNSVCIIFIKEFNKL